MERESYFDLEKLDSPIYPFVDIDWKNNASLLSVLHDSWRSQYTDYIGSDAATTLVEYLSQTGKIFEHDAAGTLIASDGGKVIGLAAIRKLPDISLVTLYEVIPEYQGRGVGQQLLAGLCTASGPLVAHVSIHRPWLVSIYERHGFKSLGTEQVDHFGHSLVFEVMAKP